MTDTITLFFKRLKGITLSNNERLATRERLAAYADMHPASMAASTVYGGFFSFIASRRFGSYALALLVVVATSGGVALAADASVPGDSLYALKIQVNEPVMTAFAATATDQARVAADIATRRVDEAVTLASRGKLTPERQAYLKTQFGERIKIAAKKASELASAGDQRGADTITANFAANLAGEAQALGAVTSNDSAQSADLLRVVVATSENISDGGDSSLTFSNDTAGDATSTLLNGTRKLGARAALMAARSASTTVGTSTPQSAKADASGRFTKHLRIDETTLRNRAAATTLNTAGILMPKTDVAIPHGLLPSVQSSVTESGGNGIDLHD